MSESERLQTACDEALRETYVAGQAIVHAMKMAVAALLEERDAKATYAKKLWAAARNERDKLRAEVERIKAERAARQADGNRQATLDSSPAVTEPEQDASEEIAELKFWVEKYRVKAEAYGGMVRGCAPALERAGHPVNGRGPDGAVGGIARAVEALIRERDQWREEARLAVINRDEARAEVERLKNELYDREQELLSLRADTVERYEPPAAPQPAAPAAGWLTEREQHALRRILSAHIQALRDQRRAMDRDGQTLGYSADPCGLKREADVIDNLLARAGSPPVVEVPAMQSWEYTAHEEALAYRAALDKAGVPWKEVPRE